MKYLLKQLVAVVFIGLVSVQSLNAQETIATIIMSSVGSINNMSNNSMAVNFNSTAVCLNLQNGTAVFAAERGTGSFAINCEVNVQFNTLGITLYPNPVSPATKVKLVKMPPLADIFSISIWSTEGFKITSGSATGYELFKGKALDFSGLNTGSYILQIESEKYRDALKFIKAN